MEKVRFLVVGAYNTLFGYVAFALLYVILGRRIHYLWLMVVAHIVAVCNAFLGHKFLTFRAEGHWVRDFLRFNLAYLGTLGFAAICLPLLVEGLRISPLAGQGIVLLLTMVASYTLHKRVSFHRKPR